MHADQISAAVQHKAVAAVGAQRRTPAASTHLDSGAIGDGLIWVDALAEILAVEKVLQQAGEGREGQAGRQGRRAVHCRL
jgi:hypothetical protein